MDTSDEDDDPSDDDNDDDDLDDDKEDDDQEMEDEGNLMIITIYTYVLKNLYGIYRVG